MRRHSSHFSPVAPLIPIVKINAGLGIVTGDILGDMKRIFAGRGVKIHGQISPLVSNRVRVIFTCYHKDL